MKIDISPDDQEAVSRFESEGGGGVSIHDSMADRRRHVSKSMRRLEWEELAKHEDYGSENPVKPVAKKPDNRHLGGH